jgi:hypothetical protein
MIRTPICAEHDEVVATGVLCAYKEPEGVLYLAGESTSAAPLPTTHK